MTSSWWTRVRERWALQEIARRAEAVPEGEKAAISETEQVGRQQLLAAERLWLGGCAAEALKLASAALHLVRAATKAHGQSLPETERLTAKLERVGVPLLDAKVTQDQRAIFRPLVEALRAELAMADSLASTPADLRVRRLRRVVWIVVLALAAIALVVLAIRPRPRLEATASAARPRDPAVASAEGNGPELAVDGEPSTQWLLPDSREGFLDVHLIPARKVHRVRLLPSDGPGHAEGAKRPFVLELWNGGTLVQRIAGELGPPQPVPLWKWFDLAETRVDRIRIVLGSDEHGYRGIAEVEVE